MARAISAKLIEDTARELTARAAIDIPADYRDGVRRARDIERNKLARFVLTEMLANWELATADRRRSEEHTSELQSQSNLVCRLLLEKKKKKIYSRVSHTTHDTL